MNRRTVLGGLAALPLLAQPRLATAAPARCSFVVLGDWGRRGEVQRQVAAGMGAAAAEVGSRFVLTVGDNFYRQGVRSVRDPLWRKAFEEVYTAPSLQTPWYPALGNHDYRGHPQAQVEYTAHSSRWRMPSRFYKVSGARLGFPALDIFVLDTPPLVQGRHETLAQMVRGRLWLPERKAQLAWFEQALAASTARWKIVVGHHPIFSGGHNGDTPYLQQRIQPLLERHGVQLYLCGHDHDLQHIRRERVNYVCAGAGAGAEWPVAPVAGSRFCVAAPGFAVVAVDPQGIALQFRDERNATLHQARIA